MDERFYTTDELAVLKGVKVDAVRMMVHKGRLHPVKTVNGGRTYLFTEGEKERYMNMRAGNPKWGRKGKEPKGDKIFRSAGNG